MYYITYSNATVVYNANHKLLVSCPTETEAREWMEENRHETHV